MRDIDLLQNVLPISKTASMLAKLLKRARETRQPIIVTQKGCPTGVLLSVADFVALKTRAERAAPTPFAELSDDEVAALVAGTR